jgi:hypothetical protein
VVKEMEKLRSGTSCTSRWVNVDFPAPEGAETTNTLPGCWITPSSLTHFTGARPGPSGRPLA